MGVVFCPKDMRCCTGEHLKLLRVLQPWRNGEGS